MDFSEILNRIRLAQGDSDSLALAAAELVIVGQPTSTQDHLRMCMDVASVVHWFDPSLLAALVDREIDDLFSRLIGLPFIERYPARGDLAHNLHQATRSPWRSRLRREYPQRFDELSERAAELFPAPSDRFAPASQRIEALYLRLGSSLSPQARDMCVALGSEWRSEGRLEESQALALTLEELEHSGTLSGSSRATALLEIAEVRWSHLPLQSRLQLVEPALEIASTADDSLLLGRALTLKSRLLRDWGELSLSIEVLRTAETRISEHYARNTADHHAGLLLVQAVRLRGDLAASQGDGIAALEAHTQAKNLACQLVANDPSLVAARRRGTLGRARASGKLG